ncbi:MAG TPA: retropepsin-like aspartic protease, partial [Stellaceae bacterium]
DAGIGVLDQNGANPDELVKSAHLEDGIFVFYLGAHASSITTNIEDEQSTYLAGYQTQPNPDYPLAVLEVQKAQQDLAAIQNSAANSNATGNAALAVAAINTVAVIVAENSYNKAIQNLRNTPPTVQVPVSAAYTYKKATIQANKTAQVAMVFIDVASRSYVATTIPVTDEKQFTVLSNLRTDDNGSSYERALAVSQTDVTTWENLKIDFNLAKVPDALAKPNLANKYDSIRQALSLTAVREAAAIESPGRGVIGNDRSSRANGEKSETSPVKKIAMEQDGGTYVVSGLINNALALKFVVDSGATDVAIPADVVSTLIRIGTLGKSDFIGSQVYKLADGSLVPSATFRIKSLKIGDIVLQNVTGSVSPSSGDPLLGQSFLRRFKSWSIDNSSHSLILQ